MPTAIVTGASQGFGLALTAALIERGWTVLGDARSADTLHAAADRLRGRGRLQAIAGDVADPAHRSDLVTAAAAHRALDLLVHNASELGPSPLPHLVDQPVDSLERLFSVNVIAPVALTALAVPLLRAAPAPVVVGISSDAAVEAYAGWGGYGASKAALDQAMAVLATELDGIHIYAFDPGDMRTAMHQRAFPGEDISDRPEPAAVVPRLLDLIATRPPSGRHRAADFAPAAP